MQDLLPSGWWDIPNEEVSGLLSSGIAGLSSFLFALSIHNSPAGYRPIAPASWTTSARYHKFARLAAGLAD